MRKIVFSIAMAVLIFSIPAQAQFDAKSKKILDKATAKYQSFRTLETDILLSIERVNEKTQSHTGTLAMERASGKFKISLAGYEIINNGKTQWTVLKDQREIQVAHAQKDDQALNPATLFTFYQHGYTGRSLGLLKVGSKKLEGVLLIPTEDDQGVEKIELFLDTETSLVDHAKVYDEQGGALTYSIRNLVVNRLIPYRVFVFHPSKYPGMEMVDLR